MTNRGFTLVETAVATGAIAAGLVLLQPVATTTGEASKRFKDADQLREIHEAHVLWAAMSRTMAYPLPSKVDIFGTTVDVGQDSDPDIGVRLNTTSHTFSILIFNGFVAPETFVSPAENNFQIAPYLDYEYHNPQKAVDEEFALWDPAFHATPISFANCDSNTNPADIGNNSYAPAPSLGKREPLWAFNADPDQVVLGNRGPAYQGNAEEGWILKNGIGGTGSNTLDFYGKSDTWRGNVVYNDGRVAFETQAAPDDLLWHFPWIPGDFPDNIFHNEDIGGDEQSESIAGNGVASINGTKFFLDELSDVNAYLRPVAEVTGIAHNLGTVTLWID